MAAAYSEGGHARNTIHAGHGTSTLSLIEEIWTHLRGGLADRLRLGGKRLAQVPGQPSLPSASLPAPSEQRQVSVHSLAFVTCVACQDLPFNKEGHVLHAWYNIMLMGYSMLGNC